MSEHTTSLLNEFGTSLRAMRRARNFSQEELGQITGLDRTYISGLERGMRNPTLKVIALLAACMGTTASQLLDGITIKNDKDY
ncbi:MAG: helix-turn-helix transcriptional regulator [Polaromonas sp.]|nr:helix-turn-helix transcriptional regulator [Polaromonas sp.]